MVDHMIWMMLWYFVCRNSGDGPDTEHAWNDKHVCWWVYGFLPRQHYKRYDVGVTDIYTLLIIFKYNPFLLRQIGLRRPLAERSPACCTHLAELTSLICALRTVRSQHAYLMFKPLPLFLGGLRPALRSSINCFPMHDPDITRTWKNARKCKSIASSYELERMHNLQNKILVWSNQPSLWQNKIKCNYQGQHCELIEL